MNPFTNLTRKQQTTAGRWPLDLPIVQLGKSTWTLRDSLEGLFIMGQTGSGKTTGPANTFANKLLEKGYGGLVLCYKRAETKIWLNRLKACGREADGRVFSVENDYRFNFLDYEAQSHTGGLDNIDNLVKLLLDIVAVRRTASVEDSSFWLPQKEMLVRNCLSALLLAKIPITLRTMNKLVQSAPNNVQEADAKYWKDSSYLHSLLKTINVTNPNHQDFEDCEEYWRSIRARMPEETRACVNADFIGMTDGALNRGRLAELFSTTTNIDPTVCFDGRVIIVDLPVEDFFAAGQYAALIWTTAFMRAAKRREFQPPHSRPLFLWADEAHAFSTEGDVEWHATCRSLGVCTCRSTQNYSGFVLSYRGGDVARLTVNSILGNLSTQVFLLNGDPETNDWASKQIGNVTVNRPSLSNQTSRNGDSEGTTLSPVEEPACRPSEFTMLRNGGPENNWEVDAIIRQSGRRFDGKPWMLGTFSQPH